MHEFTGGCAGVQVFEVVDRLCELYAKWPKCWGEFNANSIGVVTPYYDQVLTVSRVVTGKNYCIIAIAVTGARKHCSNCKSSIFQYCNIFVHFFRFICTIKCSV